MKQYKTIWLSQKIIDKLEKNKVFNKEFDELFIKIEKLIKKYEKY